MSAAIAVAAAETEKVKAQEQVREADKRTEEARKQSHSGVDTALGVGAAIVGVGAIVAEKTAEESVKETEKIT